MPRSGRLAAFAALAAALGSPHPETRCGSRSRQAPSRCRRRTRRRPVARSPGPLRRGLRRRPRRTATVVMGGDLLWHNTVWAERGRGPRPDRAREAVRLRPDVRRRAVAGHRLPTWRCATRRCRSRRRGSRRRTIPVFAAPPESAAWIGAFGFDGCTTASNHSLDQGFDGLVRTADLLERAGVAHIGTFRSVAERRRPVILTTEDGVRIGVVAGTFGTNGFPLPAGREWSVSMWDAPQPARAGARGPRGRRRRRGRAPARRRRVRHHAERRADRPGRAADRARPTSTWCSASTPTSSNRSRGSTGSGSSTGWATWSPSRTRHAADTYQGILARFTFTERRSGRFAVTRAAYAPIGWNVWHPGSAPIRVVRLREARPPMQVTSYVEGLGAQPGLHRL